MSILIKNNFRPLINPSGFYDNFDEYGVRDPSYLISDGGFQVKIKNKKYIYATCSKNLGKSQWSGLYSFNGKRVKFVDLVTTYKASDEKWDSGMQTTPHVIFFNKKYYLFYRGGKQPYDDAIGLKISNDLNFKDILFSKRIMQQEDFTDMPNSKPVQMGLPYVIKTPNEFIMMFEGSSLKYGGAQIFCAKSKDAINWQSINNGHPIINKNSFNEEGATSYANPRFVYSERLNKFLLCFNASGDSDRYYLGLTSSENLKSWKKELPYLIYPFTNASSDLALTGRIEGGIISLEDSEKIISKSYLKKEINIDTTFMAIPDNGPSHRNSCIYKSNSNIYSIDNIFSVAEYIVLQQIDNQSQSNHYQKNKISVISLLSHQVFNSPASANFINLFNTGTIEIDFSITNRQKNSVLILIANNFIESTQKKSFLSAKFSRPQYFEGNKFIRKIKNKIKILFSIKEKKQTFLNFGKRKIKNTNKILIVWDKNKTTIKSKSLKGEISSLKSFKSISKCSLVIESNGLPCLIKIKSN